MMVKKVSESRTMALIMGLVLLMSGCVTTTDSRFSREADRQKALENYVQLATAYIGQGNLDRARTHLERALEIESRYAPALAAQGLIYSAESEEDLAEKSFRSALTANSSYTRGRVYYGAFLFSKGRFEEARTQFEVASKDTAYKDRGGVFYSLGLTNERLGDVSGAEAAYRRAVELTRGEARTLLSLSRILVEQGDYTDASRYYSRLQTLISRNTRLTHSPESLYTGIRIARHFSDRDQEASLALMLRNEYPDSVEYQQYKVLIDNER